MSCHNPLPCNGPCPCAPSAGAPSAQTCAPNYFRCPVVCVPGTFDPNDLNVVDQLLIVVISKAIDILADPAQLCTACDSGNLGQLVCVDRCSIPFTGQEVTTIKVNLDSIDSGLGLGVVTLNIYEKCNTIWFKLPCSFLYDPMYCSQPPPPDTPAPPSTVGSVSITKSLGCPKEWTGRILLDKICFPISFKIKERTELIAQCGCPPYLQYTYDLVVDSPFQKFFHTQSITCLDSGTAGTLIMTALYVQVKAFFLEYVVSQISTIKEKCDCGPCAIGNNCSGAAPTCWSSAYPPV